MTSASSAIAYHLKRCGSRTSFSASSVKSVRVASTGAWCHDPLISDPGQQMFGKDEITLVRSFNRLVTSQVGALNNRYLGLRPLGEARVLFEIGTEGASPRDVRARL